MDITAESRGIGNRGNQAILLKDNSFIRSTGIDLDAADITVMSTPGSGESVGVRADLTSDITVVAGNRNITGGFERGRDPG